MCMIIGVVIVKVAMLVSLAAYKIFKITLKSLGNGNYRKNSE
jgi:hypothetical protein